MDAGTPSTEPSQRSPALPSTFAAGAAYLLAAALVVQLVTTLTVNPLLQGALGLFGVLLVASRAGVASDPVSQKAIRRGLTGAGLVAGVVAAVVLLAWMSGQLGGPFEVGSPSLAITFGLPELLAVAIRDELYLHGIPLLFAARAGVPAPVRVGYAALCSVAMVALSPELTGAGAVLVLASGLLFAVLWHRTGDPWAPAGAHFSWLLLADAGLSGELLVAVRFESGQLSSGPDSSGPVTWIAAAVFLALVYVVARHRVPSFPRSPVSADEADDSQEHGSS